MSEPNGARSGKHSAWYWLFPSIGYARHWRGRALPQPASDDPGRADLDRLLGDFATAFRDDMIAAGILSLRLLWCEGPCGERAFAVPKTPSSLDHVVHLKRRLDDLEHSVREWAPDRYAALASQWERFRPAGHLLVLEATPVCLRGEETEMQAEAEEIFRDAYGHDAPRPRLTPIADPPADDPDHWFVIIGALKLAGLDAFRCSERDGLNTWLEEESWEGTPKDDAPDRTRAQALVGIFSGLAPELSTGACFDVDGVRQAWHGGPGPWDRRYTHVPRLGSHLNFLWCTGTIGIKGPYYFPSAKGIVSRLSQGRRTYRRAVADKADQEGVSVRTMMALFEVHSPWLGQPGSDDPERVRRWLAAPKRGLSPLNGLYWDAPWTADSPLARLYPPERPAEYAAGDEDWLVEWCR